MDVQVARAFLSKLFLTCRMIHMSDFDFFFYVIKQIKCQHVNVHRECLIPAFLSKNVGPEKVVRNSSGSLYMV